jgi:hypothetical protein
MSLSEFFRPEHLLLSLTLSSKEKKFRIVIVP